MRWACVSLSPVSFLLWNHEHWPQLRPAVLLMLFFWDLLHDFMCCWSNLRRQPWKVGHHPCTVLSLWFSGVSKPQTAVGPFPHSYSLLQLLSTWFLYSAGLTVIRWAGLLLLHVGPARLGLFSSLRWKKWNHYIYSGYCWLILQWLRTQQ